MPKVAVIIPAFNPGPHLARSLSSVVGQEYTDWECIVVDDGSEPAVDPAALPAQGASALPHAFTDSRIRVHRQQNRGVSVARNVGVRLSRAPYVAFLDQDDEWHPSKLRLQMDLMEQNEAVALSHTGFTWRLPHGDLDGGESDATYRRILAGRGHVLMSSLLVRRTAYADVGGSDPLLAQQQDWALVLNLLRQYGPPAFVPRPLVTYRVHETNASRNYARAAAEAHLLLESHRLAAQAVGDRATGDAAREGQRVVRRLHGAQAVENARVAKDRGDWKAVASHLGAALSLSPRGFARAAAASARTQLAQPGRRARS